MISSQGKVDYQPFEYFEWRMVAQGETFCYGDKVRTAQNSRATLMLNNGTTLTLDQNTTLIFLEPENQQLNWFIKLFNGSVFFRSRLPKKLNIRTPFINAVHEGTEFLVSVDSQEATISVFDGIVAGENAAGRIHIAKGFSGIASKNRPPRLQPLAIRQEDAVQWTLYYPPIIDYQAWDSADISNLQPVLSAYRHGDIHGALIRLDASLSEHPRTRYLILKASLLLSVGRVEGASVAIDQALKNQPDNSNAYALQSIIALTKNRQDSALTLAEKALELDPGSAVANLALSYAYQSRSEIKLALEATQKAVRIAPDNALAWTRLAELQLSLGDHKRAMAAAQKADSLNPDLARIQTILGFAELAQIDLDEARQTFERAIELDSSDPIARLGLGLVKIRQGNVKEGTHDLDIAVSLDPNNAVARSYLGKAYYELSNYSYAETELTLAKEMDPNDPTPWFYAAIVKQTSNRPIEALQDMQKAIELNDNRGIYRSKLLLDEDAAARSANQARIYNDLGFNRVALRRAWESLGYDSMNYAAHRNLADSYFGQPRFRIARASELLQAQLMQPINITPVQPQLTSENIGLLNSTGPTSISVNEYDPLFTANGVHALLNGAIGSNNTITDNTVLSAVYDQVSMSLGQFHFQTGGFRKNDDYQQDIYDAFVQYAVNKDLTMQFELKSEDVRTGDVPFRINGFHQDKMRKTIEHDTARIGAHYNIDPYQDLLFSTFYTTAKDITQDSFLGPYPPFPSLTLFNPVMLETSARGWQSELQYKINSEYLDVIGGFGYLNLQHNIFYHRILKIISPPDIVLFNDEISPSGQGETDYYNGYIYTNQKILSNLTTTVGVSLDNYNDGFINLVRVNPKIGAIWKPTDDLTLRGAVLRALKRPLAAGQTLEPTQVAGFNQFFDGNNGSLAWQYSLGVDYTLFNHLFVGGELNWRKINEHLVQPDSGFFTSFQQDRNESAYLAYLYWTPTDWLAFKSEYRYEKYSRDFKINEKSTVNPQSIATQQIPLTLSFFHRNGMFSKFSGTHVNQNVTFVSDTLERNSENFWTFDAALGYRLPKKIGAISFEVRNMFNNHFKYQSNFDASGPQLTPFVPEREIFVRLSLFY